MESYICKLIRENPNWESVCESLNIRVKRDPIFPYVIFNYTAGADFNNSLVQEARGIIIDIERVKVVCWPFRKFGNSFESYADSIDWETAIVQEKIDGSLIKLWFDSRLGEWFWSTNSCIDASEAKNQNGRNFFNLIKTTPEYSYLCDNNEILDKNFTYMFELIGPDNQIVIKYPESHLYHIGTRSNIDGVECSVDIGIQKPKEYTLHSLDDCKKAVEELNTGDFPDMEGFVVVDSQWHRVKVKSPEYLLWHHAVNNGNMNKETAYELWQSDDFDKDTFKANVSEYVYNVFNYYVHYFEYNMEYLKGFIKSVRDLAEKGLSRKEIALEIKNDKFASYGFKALDNYDCTPEELILMLGERMFLKTVPDFVE